MSGKGQNGVFTSDKFPVRILGKTSGLLSRLRFVFPVYANLYNVAVVFGLSIPALWRKLMAAPLRRIVARELDILTPRPKYQIYSLVDTLECGHTRDVYLFGGLSDLLNAYTDNPAIRARRHRCIPCAQLLAKKRPQSVPLPAVAKTA